MSSALSLETSDSTLESFEHGINRLVLSPDGALIATGDVDMNVAVIRNDQVIYSANFGSANDKIRPTERIRGLRFSPAGDKLYVAAGDRMSALDTQTWAETWSYVAPRSFGFLIISPLALDVAETGDLAAAFDNGTIVIWDSFGTLRNTIRDNDSPRWLRFLADGEKVVGTDSFSLCVWDLRRRKHKQKLVLPERVYAMDADSTGAVIATRTLQHIVLWDLVHRDMLGVIPVGPSTPLLAFDPKSKRMAFGERNRVKVVDYHGRILEWFDLDVASALSLAFDPSGSELLIGCTEHSLIRRKL